MVLPKGVQKYKKNIKQDRGPYIYYSTDTVFQALNMQESQNVNPGGIGKAHPTVPSDIQESKSALLLSCYITREPGGIQTHDLQNRNLTLYSAKLRNQFACKISK